jgi:hypothetical protein
MGFVACARRLDDVYAEPCGRGGQECRRIEHGGSVARLPSQPRLLHDVLGIGAAVQYPVCDAEQAISCLEEHLGGFVEIRGRAIVTHRSVPFGRDSDGRAAAVGVQGRTRDEAGSR